MRPWPSPSLPLLPGRGYELSLYDSATRTVRPTTVGPTATLYVCGITPYDATHLGHAATYLAFDLVQRVWRDSGHQIRYVQNVTDVDDPLLERARERGEAWQDIAERELLGFRDDMTALRMLAPTSWVSVTSEVPRIAERISDLRDKGYVYQVADDFYYSIAHDQRFGSIANLEEGTMLDLSRERGGDPDRPGKRHPLDTLVWRGQRDGEPAWDGPLGPGRPGWHIECVSIALDELGSPFDVLGGGEDLLFPHHEYGASQGVSLTDEWPFARVYAHAGMVCYLGEKMSKSLGNLVFISILRQHHDPMAIRLALLAHHYREGWEWHDDDINAATERLQRWRQAVSWPTGPPADDTLEIIRHALADDLDTPRALEAIDAWAHEQQMRGGEDPHATGLISRAADALLGVAL